MTVLLALLLGIVQGLCEFLPVSSSGHLVLLQVLFGVEEGALFFTIMLHAGTLIAVFAVYYKKILRLIIHPVQHQVGMLIIAIIPTVIMALLFNDFFVGAYSGRYLGFGFILTAVILLLLDRVRRGKKTAESMTALDAALIGVMQGVAILPGVSRSGSTIAGGIFRGVDRKTAADFSFLLSIPAILGSMVLEIPELLKEGMGGINALHVIVGMAAAAISGYLAIKIMLRVVTSRRMLPFAGYVAILGLFVLIDQFITHLFFANPFV